VCGDKGNLTLADELSEQLHGLGSDIIVASVEKRNDGVHLSLDSLVEES
jgi:hypothetical protein